VSVESAIQTQLEASSGLTALVRTRIYKTKKDGAPPRWPFVLWELVSLVDTHHTFSLPQNFERTDHYRFHCFGRTTGAVDGQAKSEEVAKQVRLALHGHSDATITASRFDDESVVESPVDFEHHRVVDMLISHVSEAS